MSRLKRSFKHAFAIDPAGPAEPTEPQRDVVDRVCREIVRRGLTTPALMMLEMSRPLNYLGSQAMMFFQPIISVIVDTTSYEHLAVFLERRGSVEYLCRRIEHFEHDRGGRANDEPFQSNNQQQAHREADRS